MSALCGAYLIWPVLPPLISQCYGVLLWKGGTSLNDVSASKDSRRRPAGFAAEGDRPQSPQSLLEGEHMDVVHRNS